LHYEILFVAQIEFTPAEREYQQYRKKHEEYQSSQQRISPPRIRILFGILSKAFQVAGQTKESGFTSTV